MALTSVITNNNIERYDRSTSAMGNQSPMEVHKPFPNVNYYFLM